MPKEWYIDFDMPPNASDLAGYFQDAIRHP